MLRNNINAHWQYACGLLNEVLSLNAQESPMAVPRLPKILVLNEVLSLNAQESCRGVVRGVASYLLNEVLSLNAQELVALGTVSAPRAVLNEVLSLNAQEYGFRTGIISSINIASSGNTLKSKLNKYYIRSYMPTTLI